jgi:alcohol dehydrogenase class IV|tara:strand:- start:74 stop:1093 length:1020 start_codon:yes stop_codon:yes gene_type:complete
MRFKEQTVDIIIEEHGFGPWLKELKTDLNMQKVLVIASSSINVDLVKKELAKCRFDNLLFLIDSYVDPTTSSIQQANAIFNQSQCDTIIAIGGGSVIDLAKGIMYEQIGNNVIFIACPTTYAGTELTKGFMVVRDDLTKKSVYDVAVQPNVILVDPILAHTLPHKVSVVVALDALTHCLEGATSSLKNPIADGSALYGIQLALHHLPTETIDSKWRMDMAIVGLLGSKAMDCGLGHIHTITYAIANNTSLSHGELNCLFAPFVIAKTIEKDPDVYKFVNIEKLLDIYKHYILEWDLMSRYTKEHEDRFIAQAVQDSGYISHPVTFKPQDFQEIFDNIIS